MNEHERGRRQADICLKKPSLHTSERDPVPVVDFPAHRLWHDHDHATSFAKSFPRLSGSLPDTYSCKRVMEGKRAHWDKEVKKRTRDRLNKQNNKSCLEDDLNGYL